MSQDEGEGKEERPGRGEGGGDRIYESERAWTEERGDKRRCGGGGRERLTN